jgi:pimeloyl-ACP methyl ester carboxylesterase
MNWRIPGLVSLLAKNYRIVTLDNRGHGKSDKPTSVDDYGPKMVDDVLRLVDHLKIDKAHFVGYSMGGMITLKLAATAPERMLSAVIGGMGWVPLGPAAPERNADGQGGEQRGRTDALRACVRAFPTLGITREELKAITVPMVVIIGSDDGLLPGRVAPLREVRPEIEVVEIKGANHLTCVFRPEFAQAIQGYLDKQPAPQQPAQRQAGKLPVGVDFTVEVDELLAHDDGKFLWYHPRAVVFPNDYTRVPTASYLMTLQRHLMVSDHYEGLATMQQGPRRGWSEPSPVASLAWRKDASGATVAVCDVTPGFHELSGTVLAIGAKILYDDAGAQLTAKPRSHEIAYAVYTPTHDGDGWSDWKTLELPATDADFFLATPGCSQWVVEPDGSLLLPVYHKGATGEAYSATVVQCAFDGQKMTLRQRGNTLTLNDVRGLCEPSLARYGDRYFLTLRNDLRGYVATSEDGLNFGAIKPWTFDDGSELGSYNTQQHWLAHSDGLFLTYTRRGADNDHIFRHRAPIFLARVDTDRLEVIRESEKVVIPERGGELGNFGANPVSAHESWITVGEGVWNDDARKRGARGSVFIAHINWSSPNQLRGGSGPGKFIDRLRAMP